LPHQDHVYKTTDESFRFHNKKIDEIRCKLELRIRVRSRCTQPHHYRDRKCGCGFFEIFFPPIFFHSFRLAAAASRAKDDLRRNWREGRWTPTEAKIELICQRGFCARGICQTVASQFLFDLRPPQVEKNGKNWGGGNEKIGCDSDHVARGSSGLKPLRRCAPVSPRIHGSPPTL